MKNKNEYTFTYEQRLILQNCWEFRHMSVTKIARYLNRSSTFIERELQRGDILYDGGLRPQEVAFMVGNRGT
jgi:IS30 family transposase